MISRIARIDDFRGFRDWRWPADFGDLERVVVLYGANGSGKSTLAQLLRDGAANPNARAGVSLVAKGEGTRNAPSEDELWSRLHVFNKDYVTRVLQFDEPHGVTPEALLTVGEVSAATKRRIEEIQTRFAAIEDERGSFAAQLKEATDAKNVVAKQGADLVVKDCLGVPRFDGRKYQRRAFEIVLDRSEESLLAGASVDVAADVQALRSPGLQQISSPAWTPIDWNDLLARAREVIHVDVVATQLEELDVASPALREWIREGLALHSQEPESQHCLFCRGDLTTERSADLRGHFNDQAERAIAEASAFADDVEAYGRQIDELRRQIALADGSVAPELRNEWRSAVSQLSQRQASAVAALEGLGRAARERAADPFGSVKWEAPAVEALHMPAFAGLVDRHNTLALNQADRVTNASLRVEAACALRLRPEYQRHAATASGAQSELTALEDEHKSLVDELHELRAEQREAAPLAADLTRSLSRVLGRDDIEFSAVGSEATSQYEVLRDGEPAMHLSEGERTAVALLYFLARVEQTLREPGPKANPVVVIDDPVSSLDAGVGLGVSAQIWHRLVENNEVAQVVVLTHSVDLMRALHRRLRVKPHTQTYSVGEIRMVAVRDGDGRVRRSPTLLPMRSRTGNRAHDLFWATEYEYLFWRIADVLQLDAPPRDAELDEVEAKIVLPNLARKLLESFLAFKAPTSSGALEPTVRALLVDPENDMALRLIRWLHENSHLDRIDCSSPAPCGESRAILRALFEFLHAQDPGHVEGMYESLQLTLPQFLVARQTAAIESGGAGQLGPLSTQGAH